MERDSVSGMLGLGYHAPIGCPSTVTTTGSVRRENVRRLLPDEAPRQSMMEELAQVRSLLHTRSEQECTSIERVAQVALELATAKKSTI